jgi:ATP-dependent DNA helicase RecQ
LHKYEKAKAVVDYIRNYENCRSSQLMQYFGEQEIKKCEICSVCLNEENVIISEINYKKVSNFILKKLTSGEYDARNLIAFQIFSKNEIIQTLRKLLDLEKIKLTQKNTYKLNI